MSQPASPLKIGIFVLAGFAIALGGLLVLSSGRLFAHPVLVLVHFNSSVNGLAEGAPVKFKGVPVGQVRKIRIAFDETSIQQSIPVILALDEEKIVSATQRNIDLDDQVFMQRQVDNGLRASLELDSFISGRLYVQLDYLTNAPQPRSRAPAGPYFEIPSASTGLPEFVQSLTQTDLAGLALDLRTLVRSMNQMISELQVSTIRQELVGTLNTLQQILQSSEVTNTLHSLRLTSDEARTFLSNTEPKLENLSTNLASFTRQSTDTLAEFRRSLEAIQAIVGPDSTLLGQVQETFVQLSEASRAVRRLADSLERNPSAILTGRDAPASNPAQRP